MRQRNQQAASGHGCRSPVWMSGKIKATFILMRPPSAKAQPLLTAANATQFAACRRFWFYVIDDGRGQFVCLFTPAGFAGGKDLWQKSGAGKSRVRAGGRGSGPSDSWDLRGCDFRRGVEFLLILYTLVNSSIISLSVPKTYK